VSAGEQRDFAAALGGVPRRGQSAQAAADDEDVGSSWSSHDECILRAFINWMYKYNVK
jgi:hypothetical protein